MLCKYCVLVYVSCLQMKEWWRREGECGWKKILNTQDHNFECCLANFSCAG